MVLDIVFIIVVIFIAVFPIQSDGAGSIETRDNNAGSGFIVEDDFLVSVKYNRRHDGDDDYSSTSPPPPTGNPIPLWPNHERVPGERRGAIGNESILCSQHNVPISDCSNRQVRNVTYPTLIPYVVESSDAAMIIAPGGGYNFLAFDNEGTDIAVWLNSIGISAFVLNFRVPGRPWLSFGASPLMDAQRAMGLVRRMAGTSSGTPIPRLNASKIGFMGFSAGGHLMGHINVVWGGRHNRTYPPIDEADDQSCRPDFSIMVYPWRSVSQPPVNEPISGASALNVTHRTPPTMLIQTEDDHVHVENAIYYYLALKQKGAPPSELHVYPRGGHGYGRCTMLLEGPIYEVCTWPDRAHAFLKSLGVAPSLSKEVFVEEVPTKRQYHEEESPF